MDTKSAGSAAPQGELPGTPTPQKQKTGRRGNPTGKLLRAKKGLDRIMEQLSAYPHLLEECVQLRNKVLDQFIEEEKRSPLMDLK